ncbi:MAG: glycerophosphodiester phosphodiesterase [Marinilabiliaceae bacterium]
MKKVIFSHFVLLWAMILLSGCQNGSNPKVIAHRGASAYETENTLAAVEKAIALNSDAVEVDIWRTADDSLIVFHDRHTTRLADDSLVVPESSFDDLKALQLKGGEQIPSLREVLEILPKNMEIFIEIKCCWEEGEAGNVFPMLSEMLHETGTTGRATIISFNPEKLRDARESLPGVPLYWLTGQEKAPRKIIDQAMEVEADGINVHYGILSKELIDLAHESGLGVYTWTVNDPEDAGELLRKYNLLGITTDRPDEIAKVIKKHTK